MTISEVEKVLQQFRKGLLVEHEVQQRLAQFVVNENCDCFECQMRRYEAP